MEDLEKSQSMIWIHFSQAIFYVWIWANWRPWQL